MKPVYIKIKNIGPYSDAEIDFENLDNLFLITGDTGSGKTFIFDAMAVALYGKPAGRRGELNQEQLVSDFYDGKSDAFVEFRFDSDGERYKIIRYLKKETTPKNKKLIFEKYDRNSSLFEAMPAQDNSAILGVIKLAHEEFSKVILLPQGQFAELLTAKSTDKSKILSKIFDVRKFKRIKELVSERTLKFSQEIRASEKQIEGIAGGLSIEKISENYENAEKDLAEKRKENSKVKEKILELAKKIAECESEISLAREKENAEKKLALLDSKKEEISGIEENIQKARKILPCLPVIQYEEEQRKNLEKKETGLSYFKENFAVSKKQKEDAEKQAENLPSLEKELKNAEKLYDSKNQTLLNIEKLAAYRKSVEESEKGVSKINAQLSESRKNLQENLAVTGDSVNFSEYFNQVVEKSRTLAFEISKLEYEISEAKKRKKIEDEVADSKNQLVSTQKNLDEQKKLYSEAEKELKDCLDEIEMTKLLNQASEIARKLKVNCPCPVCGSTDHPSPAVLNESESDKISVLEKRSEKIQEEMKKIQIKVQSWEKEVISFQTKIFELEKLLENTGSQVSEKSLSQLELDFSILQSQKNESEKEEKKLSELKILIENLEQEISECEKVLNEKRINYEKSVSALKEFEKNFRAEELEIDTPALLKKLDEEIKTLDKKISELKIFKKKIEDDNSNAATFYAKAGADFENAEKMKIEAELALKNAAEQLEKEIKSAGFSSPEEILPFCKTQAEISDMEKTVSDYKSECASLKGVLENLKKAGNLEGLLTEQNKIENQNREFKEKAAALENDIHTLQRESAAYAEKLSQIKAISELTAETGKKLKVMEYLNARLNGKVPFDTWALGAYFEEVIQYASRRFYRFSGGQYKFLLSEKIGGQGKNGLDILVEDSHNGKQREVNSLSGGETFEASISLALAITDKVQSRGGVSLDSLFIDEGFGTLDSKTREVAMPILKELSENKTVGIISHVESFQDEIPSKVRVEKTEKGSIIQ